MKKIILFCSVLFSVFTPKAQTVANFENLTLAADTFWEGSVSATGFSSGEGYFVNYYDTTGGYVVWDGFAYSNMHGDTSLTADSSYANDLVYSAVTGSGYGGSGNYTIGYDAGRTKVYLTGNGKGGVASGFYVTNETLTYISMRNGDAFEPAFTYANHDTFVLNVTGWYNGNAIGDTVRFYLADFRDSTVSPGLVTGWQWVDLRPLGNVDSLIFGLVSSQNGQFGSNTPSYFAMDNFTTSDMVDDFITINYEQDTLIGIWPFFKDSTVVTPPYTVSVVSGPNVAGATASIINDSIWYIPSIGIVTVDTLTYAVCGANSQCITAQIFINITNLTGVENINSGFIESNIYPNPFTGSFKVSYTGNLQEMRLYDLQGQLLKVVHGEGLSGEAEINASELAAGPYLARIITDQGTAIAKIVKQ